MSEVPSKSEKIVITENDTEILVPKEYVTRFWEAKAREIEAQTALTEQRVIEHRQNINQRKVFAQIATALFTVCLAICLALIAVAGLGILEFPVAVLLALIAASATQIGGLLVFVYKYLFSKS